MIKHIRLTAIVLFSTLLSSVFLWQLIAAWRSQSLSGNLCQAVFQPLLPGNNGYIEFQLKDEQPIEP